jgi:hypothetical protein
MTPDDKEARDELGPLLYETYGAWAVTYAGRPKPVALEGILEGVSNILNDLFDELEPEDAEETLTQFMGYLRAEVEHRRRLRREEPEPC